MRDAAQTSANHRRSGKVSVCICPSYETAAVEDALRRALEPFGGINGYVRPGQRVLVKPNLLSAKDPARAITTHPNFIEALARLVREAGGDPFVGDSPGGAIRGIKRVWENTGMLEMAERSDMELVNFEASGSKGIRFGKYTFFISKSVLDADVIINAAKLKTHSLTMLTCAVKNMFGVVPGFRKGEQHKLFPKSREFSKMLVQLYKLVPPSFNVVDAITAMEGNGPSSGDPIDLGLVLAGEDAVAVDAVAADIVGYREGVIDTTRIADEMELGVGRLDMIERVGDGIDVRPESFKHPSGSIQRLVPGPVARLIAPLVWVKPVIDPARCTGCEFCAKSCPVRAIDPDGNVYRIDERKCVVCMCCHELCPDSSIDIKMSRLARFFT